MYHHNKIIYAIKNELPKYKDIIHIDESELENCSICEYVKCNIKTTCKHSFCEDCLATWFDKNKSCPYCRVDLTNSKVYCIESIK